MHRSTYAPFSETDVEAIRAGWESLQTTLACPRCHGPLTSEPAEEGAEGSAAVSLLRCETCRRYAVFSDLGDHGAPGRRHTL